jgi:hypothetical protein
VKSLILLLLLSTQTIAADLYLKNESGKNVRVKVRNTYEELGINKTLKHTLDKVFKSKIDIIYQNRSVTSTEIEPSGRDIKLRVYRKDNSWFLEPERR